MQQTLNEWDLGAMVDDAVVVASELVTNVLQHSSGPAVLMLRRNPSHLTISVSDSGPLGARSTKEAQEYSENGRGWAIITALTFDNGETPRKKVPGKTFWVRMEILS